MLRIYNLVRDKLSLQITVSSQYITAKKRNPYSFSKTLLQCRKPLLEMGRKDHEQFRKASIKEKMVELTVEGLVGF